MIPYICAVSALKKYWIVLKINLIVQLEHRLNNLIWFFVGLTPALINYIGWITVFGDREMVNGFAQKDLFSYFVIMQLLWYFIGGTLNTHVGDIIKNGDLNKDLIKPFHPILRYSFQEQGWKIASLIIILPFFLVLVLCFDLRLPIQSISQGICIALSIIMGAIIFSLWDMIIAMSAFWVSDMHSLSRLNRVLYFLLSGQIAPLVLFPKRVTDINNLLFYRYTFAFPAELIFNPQEIKVFTMFIFQIAWVLAMYILFRLIFYLGIKRYEATGA